MSELALATANIQPRNDAVIDGGHIAAPGQAELILPVLEAPAGFKSEEMAVLSLISRGNTAVQVARLLGPEFDMDRGDVKTYRGNVMDKLGTKSIAQAVHRAIKRDLLPVEAKPDEKILAGLRDHDRHTLRHYARGISNQQLARASRRPLRSLETYHDRLLWRLGAWSRPHAIRRGHELGLLH